MIVGLDAGPFGSEREFVSFLGGVVRRLSVRGRRSGYRRRETPHPDPGTLDGVVPVDPETLAVEYADLHRTLRALSDDDAALLRMRADGLDTAEIAAQLGISQATARKQVSRAARRARSIHNRACGLIFAAGWRLRADTHAGPVLTPVRYAVAQIVVVSPRYAGGGRCGGDGQAGGGSPRPTRRGVPVRGHCAPRGWSRPPGARWARAARIRHAHGRTPS